MKWSMVPLIKSKLCHTADKTKDLLLLLLLCQKNATIGWYIESCCINHIMIGDILYLHQHRTVYKMHLYI